MKNAVLFIGLPGSGKTTIVNRDYAKNFTVVSADEIKQKHPDYDPSDPEPLHQWSVKEAELQMEILSDQGIEICMDSGGVNNSYSLRIMRMLKSKGYRITLVYVETPLDVCLERNRKRKRIVPEYAIIEKSKMIDECLKKQMALADGYVHIRYSKKRKPADKLISGIKNSISSLLGTKRDKLIYKTV